MKQLNSGRPQSHIKLSSLEKRLIGAFNFYDWIGAKFPNSPKGNNFRTYFKAYEAQTTEERKCVMAFAKEEKTRHLIYMKQNNHGSLPNKTFKRFVASPCELIRYGIAYFHND